MTNSELRKMRRELKKEGAKQKKLLEEMAAGETPEIKQRPTAYMMELNLRFVTVRYPAAMQFFPDGKKEKLWLPSAEAVKRMGLTTEDMLWGLTFDNGSKCLYHPTKPVYNDETGDRNKGGSREDPVAITVSSLINTKHIAGKYESYNTLVKETAERIAKTSGLYRSVRQVGNILYLDKKGEVLIEGTAETETFLLVEPNGVIRCFRTTGETVTLLDELPTTEAEEKELTEAGVETQLTDDDFKELCEPSRVAQWYLDFEWFDYKRESEWLYILNTMELE